MQYVEFLSLPLYRGTPVSLARGACTRSQIDARLPALGESWDSACAKQ